MKKLMVYKHKFQKGLQAKPIESLVLSLVMGSLYFFGDGILKSRRVLWIIFELSFSIQRQRSFWDRRCLPS